MDEKQVRKIIRQEIQQADSERRFQLGTIQRHVHNGFDSPKVSAVNTIYNKKVLFGISGTNETTAFKVTTSLSNPTTIYASGIARTPVSGTATTKTSFSGIVELGNCFTATGTTQVFNNGTLSLVGTTSNFFQVTWGSEFVDPAPPAGIYTPKVFSTPGYFASALDPTLASIKVTAFDNESISFLAVANAVWSITCQVIIT